jgi:subtilisin family serine protease
LTTAVAALVVLTATGPAAATADPPVTTTAPNAAPRSAAVRTVTLITGDKVTVTTIGGTDSVTSVTDPHGRAAGAHVMTVGADTYVYPDAAVPYLASGALDEQLFDVSTLLKDGYDDQRSDRLPLIVTYTDAAARARSTKTPDGARRTLTLSSVQGAAISADHARAADFWSSLTGTEETPAGARAAAGAGASGGRLADGIAKVWLDGKVKATLSDTTAQIGAPEVWDGGDTGQGVDVAVLDTGIDAGHPDFAGRIAETQSFVPDQDVTDRNGHGTHVASTVAGTGAASGGVEKGVAPGASLHIGKVLANDGTGNDSWILAGMEWAARDQHAKVISMSLGGDPTDGTDPLSQAVNRLSEETGALFVIAAGNSGPEAYTVGAPGAADDALTVGAVFGPGKGVDQLA